MRVIGFFLIFDNFNEVNGVNHNREVKNHGLRFGGLTVNVQVGYMNDGRKNKRSPAVEA